MNKSPNRPSIAHVIVNVDRACEIVERTLLTSGPFALDYGKREERWWRARGLDFIARDHAVEVLEQEGFLLLRYPSPDDWYFPVPLVERLTKGPAHDNGG